MLFRSHGKTDKGRIGDVLSVEEACADMQDLSESFRTVLMGLGYAGKQIALAELS